MFSNRQGIGSTLSERNHNNTPADTVTHMINWRLANTKGCRRYIN